MSWASPNSVAVYIHWPFCAKKCPYCDFAVTVRKQVDEAAVVTALIAELAQTAALYPIKPKAHSIYLGGGTPSLMTPDSVEQLIQAVDTHLGRTENCEITLEANPTDAEAGKFAGFAKAGVNRLSLGIQSLDDTELMILGRNHNGNQARSALDLAQRHFPNFSLDLMYALPRQKADGWADRVHELLAWQPTHISLYQLTIEANTVFEKAVKRGILVPFDDDDAADLYEETADLLTHAGYPAYEVSNHAKPGYESRHNLSYWRYEDYLGIGPGAHGRLTLNGQKHATENPRLLTVWESKTTVSARALTPQEADEEAFLMSMRTKEGAMVGANLSINHQQLEFLIDQGMMSTDGNGLRATREGWLRLDTITGMLLT